MPIVKEILNLRAPIKQNAMIDLATDFVKAEMAAGRAVEIVHILPEQFEQLTIELHNALVAFGHPVTLAEVQSHGSLNFEDVSFWPGDPTDPQTIDLLLAVSEPIPPMPRRLTIWDCLQAFGVTYIPCAIMFAFLGRITEIFFGGDHLGPIFKWCTGIYVAFVLLATFFLMKASTFLREDHIKRYGR